VRSGVFCAIDESDTPSGFYAIGCDSSNPNSLSGGLENREAIDLFERVGLFRKGKGFCDAMRITSVTG